MLTDDLFVKHGKHPYTHIDIETKGKTRIKKRVKKKKKEKKEVLGRQDFTVAYCTIFL